MKKIIISVLIISTSLFAENESKTYVNSINENMNMNNIKYIEELKLKHIKKNGIIVLSKEEQLIELQKMKERKEKEEQNDNVFVDLTTNIKDGIVKVYETIVITLTFVTLNTIKEN